MESIIYNIGTNMDHQTTNHIQNLQERHDAAWQAARASSHNHKNAHHHNKKTHHSKGKGKGKQHHSKHAPKKPVRHRTHKGPPHKGAAHHPKKAVGDKHKGKGGDHHKGRDGHGTHNSKTGGKGGNKNGGHIGHSVDGGSKHGQHHGKEGSGGGKGDKEGGKHPVNGEHPAKGEHPVSEKNPVKGEHPTDGKKPANGEHPSNGNRKDSGKDGNDEKENRGGEEGKDGKKKETEGKEKAKSGSSNEEKGSNKGAEKGAAKKDGDEKSATGKDKDMAHKSKEPQDSIGALPGTKTGPTDKATTPLDSDAATPSQGNQAVPGSPFFTNAGPNIPGAPNHPLDSSISKTIATPPTGHGDNNSSGKVSGAKILAFTLIPLTIIVGAVYGVVAYRRKNTRRRALRRRLQEDAEAAAMAARTAGGDDDTSSLMSAVSYRPPAPFASEVDVTTETMESNPDIVVGNSSQHLISAPKRDEGRLGDYQDYSQVCQSQILGKKCTNHSISCFVALNHSNGGLNAMAAPRNPSAAASRVLIPMLEPTSSNNAVDVSEKQEAAASSSPSASALPAAPTPSL